MNIEIETLEHEVTRVYLSGKASGNRYIEAYYDLNVQNMSVKYRVVVTYIHMNTAIDVWEYGRGGECVCMFRYTYA